MKRVNRTKRGRYKYQDLRTPADKDEFATRYYLNNKKRIDSAVAEYKKRHPGAKGSALDLFKTKFTGGRDFGSITTAKKRASNIVQEMRGVDIDLIEAKTEGWHRAEKGFGDLRRLNKKLSGQFVDYDYSGDDQDGHFNVKGYYVITGSDVVIAKTIRKISGKSPIEVWEYMDKSEIGL